MVNTEISRIPKSKAVSQRAQEKGPLRRALGSKGARGKRQAVDRCACLCDLALPAYLGCAGFCRRRDA